MRLPRHLSLFLSLVTDDGGKRIPLPVGGICRPSVLSKAFFCHCLGHYNGLTCALRFGVKCFILPNIDYLCLRCFYTFNDLKSHKIRSISDLVLRKGVFVLPSMESTGCWCLQTCKVYRRCTNIRSLLDLVLSDAWVLPERRFKSLANSGLHCMDCRQ